MLFLKKNEVVFCSKAGRGTPPETTQWPQPYHCRIASLQLVVEDMLRTGAFQKDLLYYLGQDWNKKISPSLHAQRYCDRLLKISDEDPTLLIA